MLSRYRPRLIPYAREIEAGLSQPYQRQPQFLRLYQLRVDCTF